MLLAAVFGSPRKNGNTDKMAEAFLEGASGALPGLRVERIYVRDLRISGCLGCGHCDREGACIQKDDMERVLPILEQADAIVMAAPIYFYGLPGQLKLLVDRSQASFMRRELMKKKTGLPPESTNTKGFLLSAGATRGKRLFDCVVLTAKYFFDALGVAWAGELCFRELDAKNDILARPDALEQCREAGRSCVQNNTKNDVKI